MKRTKTKGEYRCSKHGAVELHTIVEIDEWGLAHGLSVCPKCGRPTLYSTPSVIEEKNG